MSGNSVEFCGICGILWNSVDLCVGQGSPKSRAILTLMASAVLGGWGGNHEQSQSMITANAQEEILPWSVRGDQRTLISNDFTNHLISLMTLFAHISQIWAASWTIMNLSFQPRSIPSSSLVPAPMRVKSVEPHHPNGGPSRDQRATAACLGSLRSWGTLQPVGSVQRKHEQSKYSKEPEGSQHKKRKTRLSLDLSWFTCFEILSKRVQDSLHMKVLECLRCSRHTIISCQHSLNIAERQQQKQRDTTSASTRCSLCHIWKKYGRKKKQRPAVVSMSQ